MRLPWFSWRINLSPFPGSRLVARDDMKKALVIFCCLSCFCPTFVDAVKVPGLYVAETAIMDQSAESRKAATRTCLRMVLVKLTGERYVSGKIALLPILEQAEKFVQQYHYREIQIETSEPAKSPATELHLVVKFDEETLNKSLRDSGIPVWDKERPSVLIWLVIERDNRRLFVGPEETPELLALLNERAQQRGVSILFPLMDLEDNARIQPSDVWGGFRGPITAASARYNADIILTASVLSPMRGIWEGRWRSYGDDRVNNEWMTETDLLEVALEEGIDGFIDTLATEFARTSIYTRLGDVEITVGDINSVEQYARLINYLKSLGSVSEIQVKEVRAGEVKLALTAHGGELVVVQTIGLGRTLEPVENIDGHYYRLIP